MTYSLETAVILLFLAASLAVGRGLRRGLMLFSPYYFFIGFNLLYCACATQAVFMEVYTLPLMGDRRITTLLVSGGWLALIGFSTGYLWNCREQEYGNPPLRSLDATFWLLYIPLWLLISAIAPTYGWHAFTREAGGQGGGAAYTVFAYAKYLFNCMGLLYFYAKSFSARGPMLLIIGSQTLLMLLDGGRTTYFGFMLAVAWLYNQDYRLNTSRALVYVVVFGSLIVITRLLSFAESSVSLFFESVVYEGVFGGYSAMQTVAEYQYSTPYFLLGASYLFDPFIYLLPAGTRENLLFFGQLAGRISSDIEDFAPMGGFYFIAEAYANFGLAGCFLVSALFGHVLRRVELSRPRWRWLAMAFIATLGSIFSKALFANSVKLFVTYAVFLLLLKLCFTRPRRVQDATPETPLPLPAVGT